MQMIYAPPLVGAQGVDLQERPGAVQRPRRHDRHRVAARGRGIHGRPVRRLCFRAPVNAAPAHVELTRKYACMLHVMY